MQWDQYLRYDPKTGCLFWKPRGIKNWDTKYAGKKAGTKGKYLTLMLADKRYSAHRIIWEMHHGTIVGQIDHINGDRLDNRIENLRDVSQADNKKNQKKYVTNKTGVVGVCYIKSRDRWRASIGRHTYLGQFKTREAAIEARKKAERKGRYHENNGR